VTADDLALYEAERQVGVLRDQVRDVALRRRTGAYIYGPPGTSKSHTVHECLGDIGEPYELISGHVTPMGFFDTIQKNPDGTIVLDDSVSFFRNQIGQELLLAALGTGYSGEWTRVVKYRQRGGEEEVHFSGGLIAISNLSLRDGDVLNAIKSRIPPLRWDPTDVQLAAMMRSGVKSGWARNGQSLSAEECADAVGFVLRQCHEAKARPDLRLLFEHALPAYAATKAGTHEVDWKDHVVIALRESVPRLKYSEPPKSRAQRIEVDRKIAEEIRARYNTREEQVRAWKEETGRSERAFDRRSRELRLAK
jgi:hypothetical protein